MNRNESFVVLAFLLAAGCTSNPPQETAGSSAQQLKAAPDSTQLAVTIADYRFIPSEIDAKAGQTVNLVITNHGEEEHGMEFDFPAGAVYLPSHVRPGETENFALNVPDKAGIFYFHCPVGNHYARGMEGRVVVR